MKISFYWIQISLQNKPHPVRLLQDPETSSPESFDAVKVDPETLHPAQVSSWSSSTKPVPTAQHPRVIKALTLLILGIWGVKEEMRHYTWKEV